MRYTWSTGDTACCILPPQPDGRYIRSATVACGPVQDTFDVRSEACEHCIAFSTAFTPNGDGRNDGFKAIIRCPVNAFQLRVYNRWGQPVYTSGDAAAVWNGRQGAGEAPAGVYMYYATGTQALTGRAIIVKGEVTLLR